MDRIGWPWVRLMIWFGNSPSSSSMRGTLIIMYLLSLKSSKPNYSMTYYSLSFPELKEILQMS